MKNIGLNKTKKYLMTGETKFANVNISIRYPDSL